MADEIVHFDVTGPELAPLKAFYSDLFGWTVNDGGEGYAQVETGKGLRGGLVEGEKPGFSFGVQVNDLETAVLQAKALGGTIMMPPTDNGWVVKAQVQDPAGNLVTLIQADKASVSSSDKE